MNLELTSGKQEIENTTTEGSGNAMSTCTCTQVLRSKLAFCILSQGEDDAASTAAFGLSEMIRKKHERRVTFCAILSARGTKS